MFVGSTGGWFHSGSCDVTSLLIYVHWKSSSQQYYDMLNRAADIFPNCDQSDEDNRVFRVAISNPCFHSRALV